MVKRLLVVASFILALFNTAQAQCPQIYDYAGTLTNTPVFIYCQAGSYTLNLVSNTAWGPYTIDWGDGTSNTTGASNAANAPINHVYAATVNTFVLTLTIPGASCTRTMLVVMEQAVAAGAQNFGGVTTFCAPGTVTVTNMCTNVSPTTVFTWDWGDGTVQTFNYTNQNQNLVHTFAAGNVPNCQRQITLRASNYCRPIPNPLNLFVDIYDLDPTTVTPDKAVKCFPENTFTLTNTTPRQCFAQGNTFQRQEKWNLGDYWGRGYDSIVDWEPWPPTTPRVVSYPAGLGSYTFQLLDSNLCGVRSAIQTVSIVPPPTASLIAPGGNLCQNTTITFTNTSAAGYSYKWNFGTGAGFVNLGTGNKSIVYATPGTYTVKVVAFVNNGGASCSDTASALVTILAAPVSNFTYTPATGCNSIAAVTFTDLSTGGNSWAWTFGNGNTFSGQSPPPQAYPTAGAFTASLIVTATTSCVHTKTASIVVRSTPVPNFPIFANCVNAVSNFTNNSTVSGTTAINSYTWNFGDGAPISTLQAPSHTYTLANTYVVKLIAATPFCVDSIFQTIFINVKPTANFAFTPTVNCPPFAASFTNTTLNGVNYEWRFGTAPSATSNIASPTFTYVNTTQSIQNFTVSLISITGAGCADSIKKVIAVYPEPVASFTTNVNSGCSPIAFSFSNTTIGGSTYSWTLGDGATSTQTDVVHTYSNTTLGFLTRTVELIATNSFGCMDTTSQQFQIFPEPFISFTMTPGAGCSPLLVNFSSVPGIISYTWDYGDGSPLSNATNSITHTYTNSTNSNLTFTATLMAANAFGCVDTTYGYPVVYARPVPNFTLSPAVGCSPLAVSYTNTSIGNASNSWKFGNGQTSTLPDPVSTYTNAPGDNARTFTAQLVITSADNCKDSITKQVKIFDHPKAVFSLDTPACSPKVISFFNSSIYSNAYNWSFGDGNVSSLTDPQNYYVNNAAFNQIFNVRLIATSNDGCKDTLMVPMIVHPKPVFFINSRPDSGCTPLTVFFDNTVGVSLYQWNFGDGNMANTGSITNMFVNNTPSDRIFTIQMFATDVYGCKDTAQKEVKVFPKPVASFNAAPLSVFIPNQPVQCYDFSLRASTYKWDFGDGGTSTEKSPSHKYLQKGEYEISLLVTSNKGCVDSFALPAKIVALDETFVQMPNAFTPNPNGPNGGFFDEKMDVYNDVFHPVIRGTEKYVFSIYSRWGELLFETKDPTIGWDGYYKGKLCTQDVYIWKIGATFIDGKTFNKTGDVLLLR